MTELIQIHSRCVMEKMFSLIDRLELRRDDSREPTELSAESGGLHLHLHFEWKRSGSRCREGLHNQQVYEFLLKLLTYNKQGQKSSTMECKHQETISARRVNSFMDLYGWRLDDPELNAVWGIDRLKRFQTQREQPTYSFLTELTLACYLMEVAAGVDDKV